MPSTNPKIVVRLSTELDARVAAYAAERRWSYARTVSELLMFAHYTPNMDGAQLVQRERWVRQRVAQQETTKRPVQRDLKVHPIVKQLVVNGADLHTSRSAWTSASLEIALDSADMLQRSLDAQAATA
ncbi:MAG: hypothetical protein JWN04_99 [Myxococcaceae bacterium]|nr:hypothetical protein [Myxococcaceae bacterium]